jgi:hypothetical protein
MVMSGRNDAVEGIGPPAVARDLQHRREILGRHGVIGLVVGDLLGHVGASKVRGEYDGRVTFFNGFFPRPGAWDFRHIPAQ